MKYPEDGLDFVHLITTILNEVKFSNSISVVTWFKEYSVLSQT
jgi:hypothetical protein